MKVILDPRSNYAYSSFYRQGLQELSDANVRFTVGPFRGLGDLGNDMRFIVIDGQNETKYFLHLNDSYKIKEIDYEWCDVYGCVNTNFSHYPKEKYPKLVSLVPSFAVRVERNIAEVVFGSFVQLIPQLRTVLRRVEWNKYTMRQEHNAWRNFKRYFTRRYRTWKNRLPITAYVNDIPSEDNYVFFLSTLWQSDEWNKNDETVNLRRAHFIRACKSIEGVSFEGGLYGDDTSSNEKFADIVTMQGVPFPTWIEKTKRSALVFNTPAFWDCHGWKLGEYLALGKCIISTKLSNDLPYPLEHGVNIHFVEDTEESMCEAIAYILAHPEYRHKLEKGARAYWEKYGTPEASMRLFGVKV
jgi:glycosyltransferase involved in cell wall biosynthesis